VIWRALVFLDVLTLAAYASERWGDHAAWAVLAALLAVLLPLSKAVSHLARIEKLMTEQRSQLTKIFRGYV